MPFPLRISTPGQEGVLHVSLWLKVQLLLDGNEMQELLEALGPVLFAIVSHPVTSEEALVSPEVFVQHYERYILQLCPDTEVGVLPSLAPFRSLFSSVMTIDLNALYAMPVGQEKYLIKPIQPVVQLQSHHFFYSPIDQKFHSMVLGKESVSWGLQISYPQWYQDPKSAQIYKVSKRPDFANTVLFSTLMRWVRTATSPTPFIIEEKRVNVPMRIGKRMLKRIHHHPQLKPQGISVWQG